MGEPGTLLCLYYSSYYKRQFITTNGNTYTAPKLEITSNPGIIAEATTRKKHAMAQWRMKRLKIRGWATDTAEAWESPNWNNCYL